MYSRRGQGNRVRLLPHERRHRNVWPIDAQEVQDDSLCVLELLERAAIRILDGFNPESGGNIGWIRIRYNEWKVVDAAARRLDFGSRWIGIVGWKCWIIDDCLAVVRSRDRPKRRSRHDQSHCVEDNLLLQLLLQGEVWVDHKLWWKAGGQVNWIGVWSDVASTQC